MKLVRHSMTAAFVLALASACGTSPGSDAKESDLLFDDESSGGLVQATVDLAIDLCDTEDDCSTGPLCTVTSCVLGICEIEPLLDCQDDGTSTFDVNGDGVLDSIFDENGDGLLDVNLHIDGSVDTGDLLDLEVDLDAEAGDGGLLDVNATVEDIADLDIEVLEDGSILEVDVEADHGGLLGDILNSTEEALLDVDLEIGGHEGDLIEGDVDVHVDDGLDLLDDPLLLGIEVDVEALALGETVYTSTCNASSDCSDGVACSIDVCLDTELVCAHAGVLGCMNADGSSPELLGALCSSAMDCDDNDPCTTDLCVEPLDLCAHVALLDCGDVIVDVDAGDGDGDSGTGDGDGDMGDGDMGDGDGDMGDGDGDMGDGDVGTGDGDTGDGDGDAGDGDMGDGDGDAGDGDGGTGDGDTGDGDGDAGDGDGDIGTGDGDRTGTSGSGDFQLEGGACSYGPNRGAGSLWYLLGGLFMVAFFVRRRRVEWAACLGVLGLSSSTAQAQAFNSDRNPAPHAPEDLLWTERPAIPMDHLSIFGRAMLGYADDPLVERNPATGEERKVIDSQVSMYLDAGMAFFDVFHVAALVPFYGQTQGDDQQTGLDTGGFVLGDPVLAARANVLPVGKMLELGVGAELRLPLGQSEAFVSDDQVSGGLRASLGRSFGREKQSFVALNAGYRVRPQQTVSNLEADDEISLGAGLNLTVWGPLSFTAEMTSATVVTDPFVRETTALGALFGLRFAPDIWSVAAGAGPGLSSGVGSPDYRALAAAGIRVGKEEPPEEPVTRQDKEPKAPRPIPVATAKQDPCADEETADPLACPNLDADGDTIANGKDACPTNAEDFDQFQDEDGCPDLDNDEDTIADAVDKCPSEKETLDGVDDEDGCPDKIRVLAGEIVTLEPIFFEFGRGEIQARSEPLLVEMAQVMKDRADLGVVSIQGHTDSRGSANYNRDLSQKRADAVRTFLIDSGVPSERVTARGFGEDRPLSPGDTAADHAKNRRVEFRFDVPGQNGGAQ